MKLKVGCQLEMSKPGTWEVVVEAWAAVKRERRVSEGFIFVCTFASWQLACPLLRVTVQHRPLPFF